MLIDLSDLIELEVDEAALYRALFSLADELNSALAETHQVRYVHLDTGNFLDIVPAPPSPIWSEAIRDTAE